MSDALAPRDRPVSGHFHPGVYKLLACFALLFVLEAWTFTANLDLAVVTWVFLTSMAIPVGLSAAGRWGQRDRPDGEKADRFCEWAGHDVDTWTGPLKGRSEAIESVLPIAAVGVGMLAFTLVLHIVAL